MQADFTTWGTAHLAEFAFRIGFDLFNERIFGGAA
jgi:hypothetical protein